MAQHVYIHEVNSTSNLAQSHIQPKTQNNIMSSGGRGWRRQGVRMGTGQKFEKGGG